MKKLPIGQQSFSFIRENDYLYVDKTKYIHDIINENKIVFLSRPRRFGKSLLVNTMEELFKANKKIFEGLYVYDKWDFREKYPVIKLDLSKVKSVNPEILEKRLTNLVLGIADEFSLNLINADSQGMFDELIIKIYNLFNKRVVVLVDEYDAPLNDNLENLEVFHANRRILQDFYSILKANDDYLQFIFLIGVSKIGNVSIFSKLNNPRDITLSNDFSTICGYTYEELEFYFHDYIDLIAKEKSISYGEAISKINYWYDGYSWDGENKVYNPFSTMSMLQDKKFKGYWFKTGTTTFLMNRLKNENTLSPFIRPIHRDERSLTSFEVETTNMVHFYFKQGT